MADIIVKHKTFGEGKYINIYGRYIEIQFSDGLKKFMFPNAFDNNMLETDDPWLITCSSTSFIGAFTTTK